MSTKEIPSITRRRRAIRSSITRLANRLSVLESKPPNQDTLEAAQQTLQRLTDLQAEFKILHFELVDMIEDEKALDKEQEVFDTVDEHVLDDAKICIKKIIHNCSCSIKDTSIFESSLKLKELSYKINVTTSEVVGSGVRLPKLETPKFDGNLLNWRVF